jgi:hypothetical protein
MGLILGSRLGATDVQIRVDPSDTSESGRTQRDAGPHRLVLFENLKKKVVPSSFTYLIIIPK